MKRSIIRSLLGRKGSEMVEAAIALPLTILTAVLLLRVFSFYIEILDTGVSEHLRAMEAMDGYTGAFMRTYRSSETVSLMHGGLLRIDLTKKIDTAAYLINEDLMVRAGDAIE